MKSILTRIFHGATVAVLLLVTTFMFFTTDASAAQCKSARVLAYPAWYNGLECKDGLPAPTELNDIWVIILNIIQWIIITAGYAALFFVIIAGFKYITGQGDPARIKAAKDSLVSSIAGLLIALASVAVVVTIQSAINGSIV